MMSLFRRRARCEHRWEEVSESFTPPVEGNMKWGFPGPTAEEVERIVMGFTSVKLRCAHCGDVRVKAFTGDVRERVRA